MTLSNWIRKNSLMTITESQIKGLIVVCLILAVIPFIILSYRLIAGYKAPAFTDQSADSLAVEIVKSDQPQGIYFVDSKTTINQLLKNAGFEKSSPRDFQLDDGMKITVDSSSGKNHIVMTEIEADKRLALGIKFDINQATEDDLLLIKGIGEATAGKILDLRGKLGRFRNMEQLMEIKGIKEKKLTEIRKYLYVEKR